MPWSLLRVRQSCDAIREWKPWGWSDWTVALCSQSFMDQTPHKRKHPHCQSFRTHISVIQYQSLASTTDFVSYGRIGWLFLYPLIGTFAFAFTLRQLTESCQCARLASKTDISSRKHRCFAPFHLFVYRLLNPDIVFALADCGAPRLITSPGRWHTVWPFEP